MATGRTLTYRINGEFWALEHYYPGTNRVTLQLYDGTCMEGTWDYAAPLYCFHWDGQGTSCFRHARLGAEILVIEQPGRRRHPDDPEHDRRHRRAADLRPRATADGAGAGGAPASAT